MKKLEQLLEAKSLLILDSEYNFEEVNNKWRVKNIIIKDFSLETKIKELIPEGGEKVGTTFGDPESITVYSKYVRFVSNNINVKLFYSEEIIRKIVSYGYHYLAMKIMLNNDGLQKLKQFFRPFARSGIN